MSSGDLASVPEPIHVLEIVARDPITELDAQVHYLGSLFEVLSSPDVLSFNKTLLDEPVEVSFKRGDVNADGVTDQADAVWLLVYLFLGGDTPTCLKAADANDDGKLNLADSIAILHHLFGGVEALQEPFGACGRDPTEDGLPCQSHPPCR